MDVNDQTLGALQDLLVKILSPDGTARKAAEAYLKTQETQQGFPLLILTLIERLVKSNLPQDIAIRQSASVLFKNLAKSKWVAPEDADDKFDCIAQNDKDIVKSHLVELMCVAPNDVQKQLAEAVTLISKHDFPQHWQGLLPQLVARLNTQDLLVIQGIMLTANSIMKRFRYVYSSDELFKDILFCLNDFQAPLLQQYQTGGAQITQYAHSKSELTVVMESMRLMTRIFFSLNWQDIPEFFEDNIGLWMTEFAKYLSYKNPLLVDANEDTEPGPIEKFQAAILENLNLYATKYEDIFEPYLSQFTQLVWKLLMEVSAEPKYDILATNAIKFLTSVSSKQANVGLFTDAVLKDIIEHIVVKNLTATEADEELFEDNPTDYIRKDMEGSDQDTRRRSASELVRSLLKFFGPKVSELCTSYITAMLTHYSVSKDWRAKDAALHLVLAATVKSSSSVAGAGELNPHMDTMSIFDSHVLPEVHDMDVNARPVVKADAIKMLCVFRSHLQQPFLLSILPHLIRHLQSKHVVIQTYAAMCIERFLTVKDRDANTKVAVPRISKETLAPHFQTLFAGLFSVLENTDLPENDYVMKCIMRTLVLVGSDIVPVTELVLSHLTTALERVCKNPVNPHYNHYLFESVALLVRSCCGTGITESLTVAGAAATPVQSQAQLAAAARFEALMFPPFQAVLAQDVVEFVPYVFQILAQLLCSRAPGSGLSDAYQALFPPLLAPVLWERRGNVPALTDLFAAYISRGTAEIVAGNYLTGVLGVFQKLLCSKATEVYSFKLLNALYACNSMATMAQYLPTIFNLLLHRMQEAARDSKTSRYCRLFLHSLCVFSVVYGSQALLDNLEKLTVGLTAMIINVWAANRSTCASMDSDDIKHMIVGGTRMLVEGHAAVAQNPDVWGSLLWSLFALTAAGSDLASTSAGVGVSTELDGTILESMEFDSSYSKLAYASVPTPDPCRDISTDGTTYFATQLSSFLRAQPQYANTIPQFLPTDEAAALQALLQQRGGAGV